MTVGCIYKNSWAGPVNFRQITLDLPPETVLVSGMPLSRNDGVELGEDKLVLVLEPYNFKFACHLDYRAFPIPPVEPTDAQLIGTCRRFLGSFNLNITNIRYKRSLETHLIFSEYEKFGKIAGYKVVIDNDFRKFAWISHFDLDYLEKLE